MPLSSRRCIDISATRWQAGSPSGPDSALLADAGIPTVVFGPVVGDIHGVDEWVDLASLERCHDAYLAVARELCA